MLKHILRRYLQKQYFKYFVSYTWEGSPIKYFQPSFFHPSLTTLSHEQRKFQGDKGDGLSSGQSLLQWITPVLQSTTPVLLSTTPVLLCTTQYYASTTKYYSSTTKYYASTTKYYASTTTYYSSTQSTMPVLQRTTPVLCLPRKYCACHANNVPANSPNTVPATQMNVVDDLRHIWTFISNARRQSSHPPTSPNTAPATQNERHPWSTSLSNVISNAWSK